MQSFSYTASHNLQAHLGSAHLSGDWIICATFEKFHSPGYSPAHHSVWRQRPSGPHCANTAWYASNLAGYRRPCPGNPAGIHASLR